jgi:predicted MFS family arabinose efflux permease
MTMLALPWFVLTTTGSAGRTGVVAAVEGACVAFSSLFGSPLVDRLGARRTTIASALLSGVGVCAVPLLHRAGVLQFWQLCLLAAFVGLVSAPGMTARYVIAPRLVALGEMRIERAMSWYDGVTRGARMLGAPLGGVLIAVLGPADVLLLDGATFFIAALVVAVAVPDLRAEGEGKGSYVSVLRSGLEVLRADRLLLGIVLVVAVTNLLDAGWIAVLLPVYGREVLGSSVALGALLGAFGVGALVSTVAFGVLGHRLPRWPTFTAAFLIGGSPRLLALAFEVPLEALFVLALFSGLAIGLLSPLLTVVQIQRTPDHRRAGVFGLAAAASVAGIPLGALFAGFAVEHAGLTATLAATGVLYLLVTLIPIVWASTWRGLDAPPPSPAPVQAGEATNQAPLLVD